MELIADYGLFLAKTLTLMAAVAVLVGGLIVISTRGRQSHKERIEVKNLNRKYEAMMHTLQAAMLPRKVFKRRLKATRSQRKAEHRRPKPQTKRVFVINFHGDLRASAVSALREEVTAVLTVATANDEVVVRLESGGGLVHGYGLAASQLLRVKDQGVPLTVAVDKVAASGGYMMACVADRIVAAPFAVLGSIGVVAQVPNFHRWLKERNIDFELLSAGEFKRTLTVFGENTEAQRRKAQEEIDDTHELFKDFIKTHRSQVDLSRVGTGEHWFGTRALERRLCDELRASDDYLLKASEAAELFEVSYSARKNLLQRILSAGEDASGQERLSALPRAQE